MNIPRHIIEYKKKFCTEERVLVSSGEFTNINLIIVIPALAENKFLPATISSIANNFPDELEQTLILCVINNRPPIFSSHDDIRDNQQTIKNLNCLLGNESPDLIDPQTWKGCLSGSHLRLAYIDASSTSKEMPEKYSGVGAARKLGMDAALNHFDYSSDKVKLILSLDADTLVVRNYLKSISEYFNRKGHLAAIVNYSHQLPETKIERLAIKAYEIFMRYYVLGLRYAGSPYAFHTIGSTIVCTVDAYTAIGGMNKRNGAEDFYFLNKLAKYTKIGCIDTTVYPSARTSNRVPFGTGQSIYKFLTSMNEAFLLYDPRVFVILGKWLNGINQAPTLGNWEIKRMAQKIEPMLYTFLERSRFFESWEGIQKNSKTDEGLLRHFHFWFDAFKTMKFINYLTKNKFPMINMFDALGEFMTISSYRSGFL